MFSGEAIHFPRAVSIFQLCRGLTTLTHVNSKFCDWVEANEPTTFTYCVMIRPNVPNEVLMFERYKDLPGLGVHGKSQAFKDML